MSIYDDARTYQRKADKIQADPSKHYPNGNEGKTLRRLMSTTGLSEEELRSDKKYRKILSDAQDAGEKPKLTKLHKVYRIYIKEACEKTKLPKEHPDTIKLLQDLIDERWGKPGWGWFHAEGEKPNAEKIAKLKLK